MFLLFFALYVERLGSYILYPFRNSNKLKLVMVMIIYPVMLLTLQLWLTDSFLKDNKSKNIEKKSDTENETHDGFSSESGKNEDYKLKNEIVS